MGVETLGNLALDAVESSSAYEEDVFGVDGNHALLRVFTAPLRRYVHHRAFQEFEQPLLHTFARDVASYRRVVAFPSYLVDFIDEHDAFLGFLHIVVGDLEEAREEAFYILST